MKRQRDRLDKAFQEWRADEDRFDKAFQELRAEGEAEKRHADELLAEARLHDETLRFYGDGWLAIIQSDDTFEVSRID